MTKDGGSASDIPADGSSWVLRARCRGLSPTIFFPSDGPGVEAARRYCDECPVSADCLAYALDNHIEHGVWGGASERARRRMARGRRRAAERSGPGPASRLVGGPAQAV